MKKKENIAIKTYRYMNCTNNHLKSGVRRMQRERDNLLDASLT